MTPRKLIPGPILLGFAELFDEAYGRSTAAPMPTVTPSRVGDVLLPFACPHCGVVKPEPVDKKKHDHYADKGRGFSFCPACRGRYVINFKGMPLPEPLPSGATCAPAKVERSGKVEILPVPEESSLDLLGAC